jgi:ATP-dependent DNA ligase|tara:strand:+ start:1275 stop:2429 length:1155 start_codon:yes stop_codon:yes gene_type:complete
MDKTLYRQRDNGEIKTWRIWTEQDGSDWKVWSESASSETAKKAKTHRDTLSSLDDAEKKANSILKKSAFDKGYQLSRDDAINKPLFLPMLCAKTSGDNEPFDMGIFNNLPYPVIFQRKFDGVRGIATVLSDGSVRFTSRTLNETPAPMPHIKKEIANLNIPDGIFLDGELYVHGSDADFDTAKGWINTGITSSSYGRNERDTPNHQDLIKYRIYDFFDPAKPNLPFEERYALLEQWLDPNSTNLVLTTNYTVNNFQEMYDLAVGFTKEGYEGGIIRILGVPYKEGAKSKKAMLKMKFFKDEEFEIVGFTDGDTPSSKGLVKWKCWSEKGQAYFDVSMNGSHDLQRKYFQEGDKYIGSDLTVQFEDYSKDGIPKKGRGKSIRLYE